jgi:predicted Rossmann fold nucleotide-binding protein DprA/Smf involved in DNA uptake
MLEQPGMVFGEKPPGQTQSRRRVTARGPGGPVLELLGTEPMSVDVIAREAGLASADVQSTLLELEIQGLATRCRGGRWVVASGALRQGMRIGMKMKKSMK